MYQFTNNTPKKILYKFRARASKKHRDDIAERIKNGTYKSPEQQLKEFSDALGSFSNQVGKEYFFTELARKALLEKHTVNFSLNDPLKALRRLEFEKISYVRLGVYQVFHTDMPYKKWGEPTFIEVKFFNGGCSLSILEEKEEILEEKEEIINV